MADEIIDLTRYLRREEDGGVARGAMALWGADGERARFALPLWRIIYLARAERGMIAWSPSDGNHTPVPFVALDLASDPARTDVDVDVPRFDTDEEPGLHDLGAAGLVVYLGERDGRSWTLLVDGAGRGDAPLDPATREDVLFLAGECAGLLFLRDLADEADAEDGDGDEPELEE